MKVSELFALPLRVVPHNSDPNWGAGIAEADDHVWVISVNPRTTGGFSPKLLVSAQERAEAIVAAVNERDEMRAEVERLRTALDTVEGMMRRAKRGAGDYDNAAPFLLRRVGDVADYARAVLDAGEGKG